MTTVLVERVLLTQLEQGGLTRDDIALLVSARRRGSATATRTLCAAAKATINTSISISNPLTLAGFPDRCWTGELVEVATIAIGGHLGWRAGNLYDPCGVIPATLATAAVGRPIGDVIAHADIDPTRQAYAPDVTGTKAILQVEPEYIALRKPQSPWPWLRVSLMRLRRRQFERGTSYSIKILFIVLAIIIDVNIAQWITKKPHNWLTWSIDAFMGLMSLVIWFLALDALSCWWLSERFTRQLSTYDVVAANAMNERLLEWAKERGFDDNGMPVG